MFCEQWKCVNENFDSERSGFTTFPPGRKGEVCVRYSENEKSLSVTDKMCLCIDKWVCDET